MRNWIKTILSPTVSSKCITSIELDTGTDLQTILDLAKSRGIDPGNLIINSGHGMRMSVSFTKHEHVNGETHYSLDF